MLAGVLLGRSSRRRRILLTERGASEQHSVDISPRTAWIAASGVMGLTAIVTVLLMLTPAGSLVPGNSPRKIRNDAAFMAMRLSALEDSVALLTQNMSDLRRILTRAATLGKTGSANPERMLLSSSAFAPISGYISQPFDAEKGHFGIDIATEAGKTVYSVGAGHVLFADWTDSGGNTIIVQHADGFVTVYKHNQRLLKRVADPVQSREGIAISGNTGRHTTGPHLHFELWNNGLAQDPQPHLLDL